jgi:STE24 endopeptidase
MAKTRLGLLSAVIDTGLILCLTLGGGLDWISRQIQQLHASPMLDGMLLVIAVTIISSAISLPISLYSTFRIEARYGFNKMTLRMFVLDLIKGSLIGAIIGLPLLALVLWLMAQAGPLWWLWVWLVWSAFQLLMVALYPTLIARCSTASARWKTWHSSSASRPCLRAPALPARACS